MNPPRRSVATVLFTDIVGSTETAERLGDRRWREVLDQHHAFVRDALRRYHGVEIATAGDGFLAVFESPALALLCADAIRDAVRELGLEVRAGLHHGETERGSGTVGGIAVHIGARIAALAGAGEVLVSGTVRDAVHGAGFTFEDRGERELKGVAGAWHVYALTGAPRDLESELLEAESPPRRVSRRILASAGIVGVALLLGALLFRSSWPGRGEEVPPQTTVQADSLAPSLERSIAILPFETRSSNEEDAYFARGMHDDLLTLLSQVDSLKVISRTSVERYAGTTTPMQQIADELGVATVLEGAIQRSGDHIRLTVQLIDARKDEHLWAKSYDEELTAANLFRIQTDLAHRIAGALRARLRSDREAQMGARPTESLEAYLHRARGDSIRASSAARSDRELAAREYRSALQADSTYALAWERLANVELGNWFYGYRPAEEAFLAARSAIDHALALEPELPSAHVTVGLLYMNQWRFEEAEAEYLEAIEKAPGLSSTHRDYSQLLVNLERFEEAEVEARRAVELDPRSGFAIQTLSWVLWTQRDWDGSIREARRSLEVDPGDGSAYGMLGLALGHRGDHAAALQAIETGRPWDPFWLVALANEHARAGNRTEALRLLQKVPSDATGYMLIWVAIVHGTLGESDRAFAILDRLAREDPYQLIFVGFDRDFDPIRDDPRFAEVRRRARAEVMRRNATY